VIVVHPGTATLHVNEAAVQDDCTETARRSGQPVGLGSAGQNDQAGRSALDVGAGNIGLHAEHGPARLPIVADLTTARKPLRLFCEKGTLSGTTTGGTTATLKLVSVDSVVP
jgi:hypothetical protein